jgi:molecular chaperone GrpE
MNPKKSHRAGRADSEHQANGSPGDAGDEQVSRPGQETSLEANGQDGAGRGSGDAPTAEDAASVAAEIEAIERELEAFRDRHLRLAAEYDNYRKRTERERTESWTRAQAQLVERLLDGLDDLQRVAQIDPEQTAAAALVEGVQLVERKLYRALEGAGMERIEADGQPFDPELHEALVSTPTEEPEQDETVAEVFQPGYRFKGVLLRPARVRVHKYEG